MKGRKVGVRAHKHVLQPRLFISLKESTVDTDETQTIEDQETYCRRCNSLWRYDTSGVLVHYETLINPMREIVYKVCDSCYQPETWPL